MSYIYKKQKGIFVKEKFQYLLSTNDLNNLEEGKIGFYNNKYIFKYNNTYYDFIDPNYDFITIGNELYDSLDSVEDGDMIELYCPRNCFIQKDTILTVKKRCKGLILHIQGSLYVFGTISMTARGCIGEGKFIGIDYKNYKVNISLTPNDNPFEGFENYYIISPVGGIGVASLSAKGAKGINGACAAGGNVGNRKGGNGTSFSGGSGAGGRALYHTHYGGTPSTLDGAVIYYGENGSDIGGKGGLGGECSRFLGGSGAGNPNNYYSNYTNNGGEGTGGLLIIFVEGDIFIGNKGYIESNGSKGGNYIMLYNQYCSGDGGAGSGGGAIHIFYKNNINNIDNIRSIGGEGGTAKHHQAISSLASQTAKGGDGTVNLFKLN